MAEHQIFIVGTGRSGTVVMREILGYHPRIHTFPTEVRFLTDTDGLFDLATHLTQEWNPFNASEALQRFRRMMLSYIWNEPLHHTAASLFYQFGLRGAGRRYRRMDFNTHIPVSHCQAILDTFIDDVTLDVTSGYWLGTASYQARPHLHITQRMSEEDLYPLMGKFTDRLLSYPLRKTAQTAWCDDTPINLLNADRIARMLPASRLLHLYRDPRDVVASYADPKQTWAPNDPVLSAVWVREIMTRWLELREQIPSAQLMEVKYEDLVADQEGHLRRIMRFLGLDFHPALLDISLTARSVGRHKTDIAPEAQSAVEDIVTPVMEAYYT